MASSDESTIADQAITILAAGKFHRIFEIPATVNRGVIRVSYSIAGVDIGERDDDEVPSILFCGGMFGGRWMAPGMDFLATREGVRVLFIDRPGFGASTLVSLAERIPIFLEIVPLLLVHLSIKTVCLASHSAGSIYALNLLDASPELLQPQHPIIFLFAPWVHQSISGEILLKVASMLPNPMLDHWDTLTGFFITKGAPVSAIGSGFFNSVTRLFSGSRSEAEELIEQKEDERICLEKTGRCLEVAKAVNKLVFRYAFAENTAGANDEARLCLKSVDGECGWRACESYPEYVEDLKTDWEQRVGVKKDGKVEKLNVRIYFAEDDAMIGCKGKKYLQDCWAKGRLGGGIVASEMVWPRSDHDRVVDTIKGAIEDMFQYVRSRQ